MINIVNVLQVEAKMAELQKQYQDKLNQKEELKRKAEHTELMLDRAAKLVSGKLSLILDKLYLYHSLHYLVLSYGP